MCFPWKRTLTDAGSGDGGSIKQQKKKEITNNICLNIFCMTSLNAAAVHGLHGHIRDVWLNTAIIATRKRTVRAEDSSFGVTRRRNFPGNREVKEVGLDASVAGEGAVAYDKIGAARAALWAVRGKRRVGDLQYLDSAKHVAANAGWQSVGKVTGFGDTVLQPDEIFNL